MDVQPFDLNKVPSPWKPILIREVEKLKKRPDVVAIGVAGSLAQEDTWSHSDIDIEVVLRGDHEFTVLTTEQEVSVDFGLFGENNMDRIPYETRPIYDPHGILSRELASRDLNEVLSQGLLESLNASRNYLERAEEALAVDHRSTLAFLHLYAWSLAELLTVAAGDNRTVKRTCSRLERAMGRHNREDFLNRCGQLYGFPKTLQRSQELLSHLQEGYREIWGYFRGKALGPRYMIQQPDSELWFHNRIQPVYDNDPRDLVWIVYIEFPFVTSFLFRNLTGHERLPLDMFGESDAFPETPRRWVGRHLECLDLFRAGSARKMLPVAEELIADATEFVDEGLYIR